MVKTKDQSPAQAQAPAMHRQPEPVRPGPESAPARPVFSTEARSNGIPAAARAAGQLASGHGAGGAGGRARKAASMQRSVGNARMGRMMASPPSHAAILSLVVPADEPETRAPTDEELRLLREVLDPEGMRDGELGS